MINTQNSSLWPMPAICSPTLPVRGLMGISNGSSLEISELIRSPSGTGEPDGAFPAAAGPPASPINGTLGASRDPGRLASATPVRCWLASDKGAAGGSAAQVTVRRHRPQSHRPTVVCGSAWPETGAGSHRRPAGPEGRPLRPSAGSAGRSSWSQRGTRLAL